MNTILLLLLSVAVRAQDSTSAVPRTEAGVTIVSGASKLQADLSGQGSPTELFKLKPGASQRSFELTLNQLERNYLFSATMEKGTGEKGVFSTMMSDTFVWYFHLAGEKVQIMRKNTAYRADPDTPEARAIEKSFSDSILATLPILSSDSAHVVIAADRIFLADLAGIVGQVKEAYPEAQLRLSEGESTIETMRSFPKNLEVTVQLVLAAMGDARATNNLSDPRRIAVTMHYSLCQLPETGSFTPREADERVGYFATTYNDMSSAKLKLRSEPAVSLIHRWNLEKKDPSLPVSEVKKPVVFWLEDTIPEQYRPAIKAGILSWNAAFEAVGLRNAVVVKEVDKDMPGSERAVFDAGNASYNMVRWFMGEAGFAIGPSRVNPLTGEIFNASISVSDAMTRGGSSSLDLADTSEQAEARRNMAAGMAAYEAEHGPLTAADKKRFHDEYLTMIMAHETGHTLGLRHNFKGSQLYPQADLGKDGLLSSSVMDYMPANLPAKGQTQAPFFQTKVGPYDKWAVEYGYKTLSPDEAKRRNELAEIAAKSGSDASLAFGTDEDTMGGDPDTQRFDLGRDQLAFAKQRVEAGRKLWKQLETRQPTAEEGYGSLRESYGNGFYAIYSGVQAVLPVVGGVRSARVRPGSGGSPFSPVGGAEQKAALKFLDEAVFSPGAFKVSPQLLAKMGPASMGLVLQTRTLETLYSGRTLRGLETGAQLSADPAAALTPLEMMTTVRTAVWKDVSAKTKTVEADRQALQREHLKILIGLAGSGGSVRPIARGDLVALKAQIAACLAAAPDQSTRLHLADMLSQIKDALAAKVG